MPRTDDDHPPHILLVLSDGHRADHIGPGSGLATPALDRLAAGGFVFANAYTPAPDAIPARPCIMAGQYPRTCGVYAAGQELPAGHMTLARRFAQFAYRTVACGRVGCRGPDALMGWGRRVGLGEELLDRFIPGRYEEAFDAFATPPEPLVPPPDDPRRARAGASPGEARDAYAAQGAAQVIREHFLGPDATPSRPLLLMLGLERPRPPFLASEDAIRRLLGRPAPGTAGLDPLHPPQGAAHLPDLVPNERQRALAAYAGAVEALDACVGAVLAALDAAGEDLDRWIVVYASSHGELLGERGLWGRGALTEACCRVPFVIRWPAGLGRGRVVRENASLVDLFATLCDLVGLPAPDGLDSRSLKPLLQGEARQWHDCALATAGLNSLLIRRYGLKYLNYSGKTELLFDLAGDPAERVDLLGAARYARDLHFLRNMAAGLGFPVPPG